MIWPKANQHDRVKRGKGLANQTFMAEQSDGTKRKNGLNTLVTEGRCVMSHTSNFVHQLFKTS